VRQFHYIIILMIFLFMISLGFPITFRRIAAFPSADFYRAFGFDTDQDGRQNLVFSVYPRPIQFWEHIGYDRYVLEDTTKWSVLYDVGFLDADSLVDMVGSICGGNDPLYIYESPFQNTHPTDIVWQDSLFYNIYGGYITDLDKDSIKEVLFSYGYLDQPPWYHTCVYENTGDNLYTKVWEDTIHESAYFVNGDFDQDGHIEFISSTAEGYVYIWECIGDNNYQFIFEDRLPYGNNYDIFSANDMDGNGKPEFLFTTVTLFNGHAHLWCYESVGDNDYNYFFIDSLTGLPGNIGYSRSICGDIDADGIDEIVWSSCNQWHIFKAIGLHQYQNMYSSDWTGHGITELNTYDLNENGYPEVIESYEQNEIPYIHGIILWEIEGVRLHQPNGGEVLQPNQQYPIAWEKFDPPDADSFALFYSYDNGFNYDTIVTGLATNDTSYLWTVPNTISDSCKVMIWAYGPPRPGEQEPRGTAWDFSDTTFRIVPTGISENKCTQATSFNLTVFQNPALSKNIKIQYTVPQPAHIKIIIYNILGQAERILIDEVVNAGSFQLPLDNELPSGVHFINLESKANAVTKKLVIIE
jgi:hypothetical protein